MMTRRFAIIVFCSLFLLLAVASSSLAAPQVGVRNLSMGGAGVALADDGSAPFINPAGVSLVESTFTLQASGDFPLFPYLPALFRLAAGEATSEDYGVLNILKLDSHTAGLLATYADRWYGVSILAYGESMYTDFATALCLTLTGAYKFEGALGAQFLSVGANAHLFKGAKGYADYDSTTQLMTTDVTTLTGCAFDASFLVQVNDRIRIGIVGRNLWHTYEGLRTYRVTDTTNGGIIAENTAPCHFDWEDWDDLMEGNDELLFVDYLGGSPQVQRITIDFGTALKPFKSENITLAFDVRGIWFGYEKDWAVIHFSSVNLGYEQSFGPFALRLGLGVPDDGGDPKIDFAGGLAYRTDGYTFGLGVNWGVVHGLNTHAGFAWHW